MHSVNFDTCRFELPPKGILLAIFEQDYIILPIDVDASFL